MTKFRLLLILLLLLVIMMAALVVSADGVRPDKTAGQTYHWQLENGDDAYILCADCRFDIEINGDDSIHIITR